MHQGIAGLLKMRLEPRVQGSWRGLQWPCLAAAAAAPASLLLRLGPFSRYAQQATAGKSAWAILALLGVSWLVLLLEGQRGPAKRGRVSMFALVRSGSDQRERRARQGCSEFSDRRHELLVPGGRRAVGKSSAAAAAARQQ